MTARPRPASATSLRLYLDASSRASQLVLGLYADAGGEPGALLGSGHDRPRPTAGAWNTVTLAAPIALASGHAVLDRAAQPGRLDRHAALARPRRRAAAGRAHEREHDADRAAGDVGDRRPLQRRPGVRRGVGSTRRSRRTAVLAVAPASVALAATQGGRRRSPARWR